MKQWSFDVRSWEPNQAAPWRETSELGRPSPGQMARLGKSIAKQSEGRAGEQYLPVGGRVRKPRAVEGQSALISENHEQAWRD